MGDWSFYARLDELARGDTPLVALEPLGLTDAAVQVLGGRADRVELCGIDRWLGGVHLDGTAAWRRDRGAPGVVSA